MGAQRLAEVRIVLGAAELRIQAVVGDDVVAVAAAAIAVAVAVLAFDVTFPKSPLWFVISFLLAAASIDEAETPPLPAGDPPA